MAEKVLVPWDDVIAALSKIDTYRVGGVVHVDALELISVTGNFAGLATDAILIATSPPGTGPTEQPGGVPPTPTQTGDSGGQNDDPDGAERIRLAKLPLGECYVCHHGPHMGSCEQPGCQCADYVDSVIREPAQVRLMGGGMGPGGEIQMAEPGWNPAMLDEFLPERDARNPNRPPAQYVPPPGGDDD